MSEFSFIKNPYGDSLVIRTNGLYYKVLGRNGEIYISRYMEGAIGAFMEDVYKDKQVFTSPRDSIAYKAYVDEKQTKNNDGKNIYIIELNHGYLV